MMEEEYSNNEEIRSILRFRDFEIDENDFHEIDNILSSPIIMDEDDDGVVEIDLNRIHTVSDAVLYGLIKVGEEEHNEKKRVTGISTEFLEKWRKFISMI
jgi:hypothetical protein